MKRTLDKKESIFVLFLMTIFSLFILMFSFKTINNVKDLNLQADITKINTLIIDCYIHNHNFPKEEACNLKFDCDNFRKKVSVFTEQDIYYNSDGKDYILYSPSFVNHKMYFVIGPDLLMNKVLGVPKL